MFDGRLRLEFCEKGREHGLEAFDRFSFQNDRAGERPVSHGVAGGGSFAFRSLGAVGFGSIGPGGLDLKFGSHFDSMVHAGGWGFGNFRGVLMILKEDIDRRKV